MDIESYTFVPENVNFSPYEGLLIICSYVQYMPVYTCISEIILTTFHNRESMLLLY